ncbi:MAG: hypothetical protein EBW87_00065 [Burkholderiaceae bacterium]|nr:hypothetical protein [Burkholderiaceae bacterium]
MAKINYPIVTQSFELIRDQIAKILAEELDNQFVYTYDNLYKSIRVFTERFKPINESEYPMINVSMVRGDFADQDIRNSQTLFSFFIDVYTSAKATKNNPGDEIATKTNHKLAGKCRFILKHSAYKTLGFLPGLIARVTVRSYQFDNKPDQDAYSVCVGRIVLEVQAGDLDGLLVGKTQDGFLTDVKLFESDQGYNYFAVE